MIIKEFKSSKSFLFFKEETVIVTDQGKISLDDKWDISLIEKLNDKSKCFKIESAEDFTTLKGILDEIDKEKYKIIEKEIIKSIKNFWRFFNPTVVQVPRPVYVVFNKENGAREFVVFSLNARDFEAVVNSCRHISDTLKKKIPDTTKLKEEEILMAIKEAIDSEHELVDFELRMGIVFNNFNNGMYEYTDGNLDSLQQFGFISKLIDSYSVAYVENAFGEEDLDSYRKLNGKYKNKCLICSNSKINEYSRGIGTNAFNAVVIRFNDIPSFKTDISFFKDNNINIIFEGENYIMDIVVGLGIPLVKLHDDKLSNETARRIKEIVQEIILNKNSIISK